MKVVLPLPFAVRIGFWTLVIGFVLGIAVGYRAGESTAGTDTIINLPGDVHASAVGISPGGGRCISTQFSLSSSTC